jgi:hypothetical protein
MVGEGIAPICAPHCDPLGTNARHTRPVHSRRALWGKWETLKACNIVPRSSKLSCDYFSRHSHSQKVMTTSPTSPAVSLRPTTLCRICQSFNLNAIAAGRDYSHHGSLSALEVSASEGCSFCSVIWHCLNIGEAAKKVALDWESQQIYVQYNHNNMHMMPELGGHSAFDKLWVTCGESSNDRSKGGVWGQIELYVSRSKLYRDRRCS